MSQNYKISNVNWKKVLENYRSSYNFSDEWEITLLELIANSIDAEATGISLYFSYNKRKRKLNLICEDNGKGMDYSEFEEYHNLGSLSKDRQSKSIGFAGIGAKLCLDLCDKVYTETSNGIQKLASEWFFDHTENLPKYVYITSKNKLKFSTGTFVEIIGLKIRDFDLERAKNLILDNYKYVLVPFGKIKLKINDNEIYVKNIEKEFEQFGKVKDSKILDSKIKIKNRLKFKISGKVYILEFTPKNSRLRIDPGLDIVVCGKKVSEGELFKLQYNLKPNYFFMGYVRCDELIQIVKTSKDGLNKNTKIWTEFQKGVADILETWFKKKKIWRDPTKGIKDLEIREFLEELGENLNDIMYKIPEFSDLLSPLRRKTLIPDKRGKNIAADSDTGQLTTGTIGGLNPNSEEKVPTKGPDNMKSIDKGSEKKAVKKTKKIRGIKITIEDLPIKERIYFKPNESLFIINSTHPAYKFSEAAGAIDIYLYFLLTESIVQYSKEHGLIKSTEDYLWKIYEELIKRYTF